MGQHATEATILKQLQELFAGGAFSQPERCCGKHTVSVTFNSLTIIWVIG
jgi:hypothetical protein